MSSTTAPPGSRPLPSPPAGTSRFAGMVAFVDDTDTTAAPGTVVAAIAASQQGINHLQGRKTQLIEQLYLCYRDEGLLGDLHDHEIERLLATAAVRLPTGHSPYQVDLRNAEQCAADQAATKRDLEGGGNEGGGLDHDTHTAEPQRSVPAAGTTEVDHSSDGSSRSDGYSRSATGTDDHSHTSDHGDTGERSASGDHRASGERSDTDGPATETVNVPRVLGRAGLDLARVGVELGLFDVTYLIEAEKTACRMVAAEVAIALGLSPREASALVRRSVSWSMSTPVVVEALARGELNMDKAIVIGAATRVLTDTDISNQVSNATSDAVPDGHDAPGEGTTLPSDSGPTSESAPGAQPVTDPGRGSTDSSTVGDVEYPSEGRLPATAADRVAADAVSRAAGLSRRQVSELVDELVMREDPAAAEKRHRRDVGDRRLELEPGFSCTATVKAIGAPADLATAAFNRIDVLARRAKAAGDERHLDQVRCDLALTVMAGTARFTLVDDSDEPNHANPHEKSGLGTTLGGSGTPLSVGCECVPDRACWCECGTAYADPAELARLEQYHQARDTIGQADQAGQACPALDGSASQPDTGAPEEACAQPVEFPLVPVAPGEVPGRTAGLPGTVLTVPLETVLSWATNTAMPTAPPDGARSSAWLERVGPLIDTVAQRVLRARLAATDDADTGEFRIAVTDKQGRVVQYHALSARTLRGLLREAMAVDYGTCLFPTCGTPAIRCQADHAREYAMVRATRVGNIEPLCAADHTVKTRAGYRVERTNPHDAGSPATWQLVMRSGHRHQVTVTGSSIGTVRTTTKLRYFDPDQEERANEERQRPAPAVVVRQRYGPDDPPPF